jgi:hypothetical protein
MAEVDKGIEYLFSRDQGFQAYGTIYKDGHFVINKSDRNYPGGMGNTLQTIYEYNTNVLNIKIIQGSTIWSSGYKKILEPYHFICALNDKQINIIFNLLMKMYESDNFNTHSLDNITVIKTLDEYWYSEQQKSKEAIDELTTKYELQIKQLQDENELLKTKSVQSSHTRVQSHRRTHSANRAPERRTPSRQALSRKVTNRRSINRTSSNARRTSKGYSV